MARPIKKGLDYFPMDVTLDLKMQLLKAKYGLEGLGFIDLLYRVIYNEGYYIKLDDDSLLMLAGNFGIKEERFRELLKFCIEKEFFHEPFWNQHKILTSQGIQKRYFHKTVRRVDQKYEFLLAETQVSAKNDDESKGNKNKGNESKEKNKEIDPSQIESVQEQWNSFAQQNGLSEIRSLSKKRVSNIKSRLKEKAFKLDEIFSQIEKSPFLRGKNERGWKVDFDFVFGSTNNYLKILEGKYNGKRNSNEGATSEQLANVVADRFKRQQHN